MRGLVGGLLLVLVGTAAWGADDSDRRAARATIERQLEAFRKNDPATAYAQAAPEIQHMFSSPETFIAMVEQGYKPVLHPRSYSFDKAEDSDGDQLAQGVMLQDDEGVDWMALYLLQKQSDGQWRITGCHLKKAPGTSA
jgi:hypothetical protein